MMKIAIVTIQSMNYGNRLQNYALQEVLRDFGEVKSLLRSKEPPFAKLKHNLRATFGHDNVSQFRRFDIDHIDFAKEVLSDFYTTDRLAELFDKFVIGSDQVWNPTFSFNGSSDYLPMVSSDRKIAYAASFGVTKIEKGEDEIASYLQDIPAISMREEAGAAIVKKLTGRNVPVVLDPTMLLSVERWRAVAKKPKHFGSDSFVFKYVLGNDVNNSRIDKIALDRKSRIIDINDESLCIGPAEFVWLIDHCDAVCTDSFHASVFALLYHKPLGIYEREDSEADMSSRLDTLCSLFGAERCRANSDEFNMNCINWEDFEVRLHSLRSSSLSWLENALNGVKCG